MVEQGGPITNPQDIDNFQTRVREHGRVRAMLESFAYVKPFGGMFGKIVPFYVESYWYAMGGLTFLMFVFLTGSGIILALLGPYWWLTNPVGEFIKSFHYWSAQGFFFFALLHLFRVWATGSFRGRRIFNWWIGLTIFMLAMGENLFGLLARGDWESQFVSMHSDDMLFIQPFFFHLFSPANFTADLAIHISVLPVVIAALILGHIVLVRIQGLNPPLPATAPTTPASPATLSTASVESAEPAATPTTASVESAEPPTLKEEA